ncbi:hypothetical protein MPTK1_7g10400 [Marchantia polymorpha subsp. ruderalis]|uniref:Uncharacterized protein n=2 Tax=Marchantia polymorpha TaxID=3197 RepID=A0AAF6BY32_MARPO|nr:hypothetical protein MARPO_0003s0059 [Marchantia polymorpha]BBN16916.1 hypothetical protein Mp_7g10400 [Marchantia polymorpha subsp. ruderalis]|eukprot:PTQ49157.1 hypothetical protein MARPO_0003s0059 [Marchantia polymorpha]
MAGTFVARLKSPFLRIRRCRSLKVGSNEHHPQEPGSCTADFKQAKSPPSFLEKKGRGMGMGMGMGAAAAAAGPGAGGGGGGGADRLITSHQSLKVVDSPSTTGNHKPSAESLVEYKRRRSDVCAPRRRRRTFDGGKGRMCRDGSLQTLFRDAESSEPNRKIFCAAPILRKLSNFFGRKRAGTVSCIQGMDWSSNLQNHRPRGYKLFSKRKRSVTLVRFKKDAPTQDDSNSGGAASKLSPRRTPGRELLSSSPMSPPVTLARSEEACPFGLEDTSVYDERIHMTETANTTGASPTRSLSPISREQPTSPNNFDDEEEDDDDDLGMEEDDSYLRKYGGASQPPYVVFCIRPRRYSLAPSRFQREHLERLRNAAKVSPSRRNSEDL